MTNLEGMHSYFWLASSRLREPIRDEVPYTTQALRQDLLRVRNAWEKCQARRDRNAIYGYLSAVFDLAIWWKAEGRAVSRDLAYTLVRFVGRQRGAAIGDELIQIKHSHIPSADAVVRSDQACSRISEGAHAF